MDSGRQRRTRFSSRGGRVRDVAASLLFPMCLSPCVFLQMVCAVPSGVRLSVCRRHTWVGERGGRARASLCYSRLEGLRSGEH